ncbi:Pycsar system effector family protein [Nonomuraea sp. NPDC052129]|uniref:Pycsar system effector family protein n=1 Tax=Nonomuraea sp. NPDC052129 TaxID=3154651 RepID=UPI00341A15A6
MTDSNRSAAHAQRILGEIRDEAARADTKASILLATTAVAVGAVLGGLFAGRWRPHDLGSGEGLWWCGSALACTAIVLFLAAVYPRRGSGSRPNTLVSFFGDALRQESSYSLITALERSSRAELDTLANQIFAMSRLVRTKYLLIQVGVWTLASAAAAWLVSPFLV